LPGVLADSTKALIALSVCLTLHFNDHFAGGPGLASTSVDFIGAKDDGGGGDNWSYTTSVKLTPPTNQHPNFYQLDAFCVAQPTVSKH